MTAQYAGRKSESDIKETIGTTFTLMLLLAAVSTAATWLMTDRILAALNTPAEAYVETRVYFRICMTGSVFIFGYNAIASILRGLGDSKTPMYFGIGSCILNILLDILFVGVLKTDVSGAALATVISQAASMIACVIYLKATGFIFDFRPRSFRLIPQKISVMQRLGAYAVYHDPVRVLVRDSESPCSLHMHKGSRYGHIGRCALHTDRNLQRDNHMRYILSQ